MRKLEELIRFQVFAVESRYSINHLLKRYYKFVIEWNSEMGVTSVK